LAFTTGQFHQKMNVPDSEYSTEALITNINTVLFVRIVPTSGLCKPPLTCQNTGSGQSSATLLQSYPQASPVAKISGGYEAGTVGEGPMPSEKQDSSIGPGRFNPVLSWTRQTLPLYDSKGQEIHMTPKDIEWYVRLTPAKVPESSAGFIILVTVIVLTLVVLWSGGIL
jgi:hypothetical protein